MPLVRVCAAGMASAWSWRTWRRALTTDFPLDMRFLGRFLVGLGRNRLKLYRNVERGEQARGVGARGAGAMTRIGVFKKGFVALREPEGYMTYTAPRLRAPRAPRGARVELALYDHYLEKPASFSTTSPRSAPRAPPIMVPPATNNSGVFNSSM